MLRATRISGHALLTSPLDERSLVIDLGLNEGNFAFGILARFGCRVLGVEPVPDLFAALPAVPGLTALPVAAGGRDGAVELHVNPTRCATTCAGLLESGATRLEVECVSLRRLMDRARAERVTLLKIDIEGAELDLLLATEAHVLRRVDQITVEFHDWLDRTQRPQVEAATRRLTGLGFHRIDFSRIDSDVLFINTSAVRLTRADRLWLRARYKYPWGVGRWIRRRGR